MVLSGPRGLEVARKLDSSSKPACTGTFLIPLEHSGGAWKLAAYVEGSLRHSVDLEVDDLEIPKLLLALTVLARVHYPGKPIRGAKVEYRAAHRLARAGFEKVARFMDRSTGGFGLLGENSASVRATVTGLRQLALYSQLFQGEGRRELEAAVHWLEDERLQPLELLYVTCSLHDAGRTWRRSVEAAMLRPETIYEAALQAAALTSWPRSKPAPESLKLPERLARLLDRLEKVAGAGAVDSSWGVGIMGSSGNALSLEVTALAAGALFNGGRIDAAHRAVETLARNLQVPRATQGKLLALRALARITGTLHPSRIDVELTAAPGGTSRATRVFQSGPPIELGWATQLLPGEKGSLSLDARPKQPVLYRLGCRYQVARPVTGPDAVFGIACSSPRVAEIKLSEIAGSRGKPATSLSRPLSRFVALGVRAPRDAVRSPGARCETIAL